MSWEQLFQDWREKDPNAFDRLYRRFYRWCLTYFFGRTGDWQLSEDLVQKLWLRLYQTTHVFKGDSPGQFFQYIRKAAYRLVIDEGLPHPPKTVSVEQEILDESGLPGRDDIKTRAKELAEDLIHAAFALPAGQRDLILLFFAEGMSRKEVAHLLDTTEAAVSARLHRALKRYGQAVSRLFPEVRPDMLPAEWGRALSLAFEIAEAPV
jgi:RNA polymerase sigma factor (sigma-70 family)